MAFKKKKILSIVGAIGILGLGIAQIVVKGDFANGSKGIYEGLRILVGIGQEATENDAPTLLQAPEPPAPIPLGNQGEGVPNNTHR